MVKVSKLLAQEPTEGQKAAPPYVEGSADERWPSAVLARATVTCSVM